MNRRSDAISRGEDNMDEADNIVGKIKYLYCMNFVTYEECTFCPTEYLNIIIGPNGTGKSTIVAAIVLGLGGDPKLLSRSSSIKDYIKNGKTESKIKIELNTNNLRKSIIFQRIFDINGKSLFFVNDESVSKGKFLEAVAIFKIQIGNLCQFLPQDRVQDFTKMNSHEILLNTINSVCDSDVIDNFNKLKELQKRQLSSKSVLDSDCAKLTEYSIRLNELNKILERFHTRREFVNKLNVCNRKKLWIEVDQLKAMKGEHEMDLLTAKANLEQRQKYFDEMAAKQTAINEKKQYYKNDAENKDHNCKHLLAKIRNLSNHIDELKKKVRECKTELDKKKRDRSEHNLELCKEVRMLEAFLQDLDNAKTSSDAIIDRNAFVQEYEKNIAHLKETISSLIQRRSEINKKLDEEFIAEVQMLRKRLERLNNIGELKMQVLRGFSPNLFRAVNWLKENSQLFEGKIYNPMILELNVPNSIHAKYFENTISQNDLFAFTCENSSDVSKLIDELSKLQISINVVHSPPAHQCNFCTDSISNLRPFGFEAYLLDLLEGPAPILNYLCSLYKIHTIPIGNANVSKNIDSMPVHVRVFFADDVRYAVSISKYTKARSVMQNNIKSKQWISSVDVKSVQHLTYKLNDLQKKN